MGTDWTDTKSSRPRQPLFCKTWDPPTNLLINGCSTFPQQPAYNPDRDRLKTKKAPTSLIGAAEAIIFQIFSRGALGPLGCRALIPIEKERQHGARTMQFGD